MHTVIEGKVCTVKREQGVMPITESLVFNESNAVNKSWAVPLCPARNPSNAADLMFHSGAAIPFSVTSLM